MDNGRSVSNYSCFQSCSYANDVAIPRTSYIATRQQYYCCIVSVITKTIKALTCVSHKISKTAVVTHAIKILEAAYLLLLIRRKKRKVRSFLRPKTPLVACVFYFVLICTSFWLNVNRYTCFWHLPIC